MRSVAESVEQICTFLTEKLTIVAAFLLQGNRKRKTVLSGKSTFIQQLRRKLDREFETKPNSLIIICQGLLKCGGFPAGFKNSFKSN